MADPTHDVESPPVAFHNMFDDGKAKPSAADLPRSRRICAVKPFGQSRHMLGRDAFPFIGDRNADPAGLPLFQRHPDVPVCGSIFEGVFNKIAQHLGQLPLIPQHWRRFNIG